MLSKYSNIYDIYNVLEKINNYSKVMSQKKDNVSIMIEVYKYLKENLLLFYSDGRINDYYSRVIALIMTCEAKLPKTFITESNPVFDYYKEDHINMNEKDNIILEKIVLLTRKELLKHHSTLNPNEAIKKMCFTNDCCKSSNIVKRICDDNDIKNYVIKIDPGFSDKDKLCNGNGFHYFNIIKLNKKYYLIDCTYRQFFKTKGNFLEKIGLLNMQMCLPGTFILMNEERMKVANKLLKDGWIELDEKILKTYLDSFAISYRNGLYYEKTHDYSYETNYTPEDYINFLKEKDNQINHEGREVLGYQKRL